MRVDLLFGAYEARSLIANAQRCVNLYPEKNPKDAAAPVTHYPTPGLKAQVQPLIAGAGRGLYTATNGKLYYVAGKTLYFIDPNFVISALGTLLDDLKTPVSMVDNGLALVLVDGTKNGYAVDLATNSFAVITDPAFLGADRVDYVDTFLVFNQPASRNFYCSLSNCSFGQLTGAVGAILDIGITAVGTRYTDGTYTNVALLGGSGTGATADITVLNGVVTAIAPHTPGVNYLPNDPLQTSSIAMGVPQGTVVAGSGYVSATYTNVPMTGGTGTGMKATIVVTGGAVASVTVTDPGIGYLTGDVLSCNAGQLGGGGSAFTFTIKAGTITPGSGYTHAATYTGVAMTDGVGTGMKASITVAGGVVTTVVITTPGVNYAVGDVLSAATADLGGTGSGFAFTLTPAPWFASFQVGLTGGTAFEGSFIASKTGFPDEISTILCLHREIWIFGIVKTTEVWYDAGGALFPFAILPGVFIEQGCVAKYSPAKHDLDVFWLGIDAEGQGTVFMGSGYAARRISTPAIAYAFTTYSTLTDAIGMMYMQGDHVFYLLTFPTADKTWVYDVSEGMWHERMWTNPDTGMEHRHRANCFCIAYGKILCADWENGAVYTMQLDLYDDDGDAIVRRRGLPHLTYELQRQSYSRFVADMECGRGITNDPVTQPQVSLRVSDTRGRTWWEAPMQSLGLVGQYNVQPKWSQMGMARDRVFELYWSDSVPTALNCAYVEVTRTVEPGT